MGKQEILNEIWTRKRRITKSKMMEKGKCLATIMEEIVTEMIMVRQSSTTISVSMMVTITSTEISEMTTNKSRCSMKRDDSSCSSNNDNNNEKRQ